MTRGIGLHGGGVIDDEIGIEAVLLPGREPQEHVVGEEVVPRALGDHAHVDPVAPVRSRPGVANVQIVPVQPPDDLGLEAGVVLFADGDVDVSPVDDAGRAGLVHDEAVVGGAPGVGRGVGDESAPVGEPAGPQPKRLFVELRGREIPAHAPPGGESLRG